MELDRTSDRLKNDHSCTPARNAAGASGSAIPAILVLAFAQPLPASGQSVALRTSSPSPELKISPGGQPSILQRQKSLTDDWESLFVVTPGIEEKWLPVNTTGTVHRQFFRLLAPSPPEAAILHVDVFPSSDFLGSLEFPNSSHFYFFGTKDSTGIPTSIDSITYDIGDRSYAEEIIPSKKYDRTSRRAKAHDLLTLSGSIDVLWSSCGPTGLQPSLQWKYTDPVTGTVYTGLQPTKHLATGDLGAVYEFDLTTMESPDYVSPPEVIGDALLDGVMAVLPTTGEEVAQQGALDLINATEGPPPTFVRKTFARLQLLQFWEAFGGNLVQRVNGPYLDRVGHFPNLMIRGVICSGGYVKASSPWVTYSSFSEIPTIGDDVKLTITLQCGAFLETGYTEAQSTVYISNGTSIIKKDYHYFEEWTKLTSSKAEAESSELNQFGRSSIQNFVGRQSVFIKGESFCSSNYNGPANTFVVSEGTSGFKIAPINGLSEGQIVTVELTYDEKVSGNTQFPNLNGSTIFLRGQGPLFNMPDSGSKLFDAVVGQQYYLIMGTGLQLSGVNSTASASGTASIRLVGERIQP